MLKKEILSKHNLSSLSDLKELLPNKTNWGNIVVTDGKELRDNGTNPAQVSGTRISGGSLIWNRNADSDVLGYRIYAAGNFSKDFRKVASIPASKSLSASIGNTPGAYYVVAVDVAGKESPASAIVKNGDYQEQKPAEPKPAEPKPQDSKPAEPKPPQPPGKPEGNGKPPIPPKDKPNG